MVRVPDRVLKTRAPERPVNPRLLADLVDTMRASPACVGLAAPQIGISARAIVIDVASHPKTTVCHGLVALVDPVILERNGTEVAREGCMSVPDLTADVARSIRIVVGGIDPAGEQVTLETEGFEARALQHEIDHLDGLLILDRVESLARDVWRRRVYR